MKRHLLTLLAFSLFQNISIGQTDGQIEDDSTIIAYKTNYLNYFPSFNTSVLRGLSPEKLINLDANFIYASSHINNGMASDFYFKRKLDEEKMKNSFDRTKGINTTGYETEAGLSYFSPFKNNTFLSFGYKIQSYQGLSYSEDFYKLLANGNAAYEDTTVNGDGLGYHQVTFDQVYVGFLKRVYNDLGASNIYGSIGLIRGMSFNSFDAEIFRFYTAPYGQEIDITLKSDYSKSNPNKGTNGYGLGLNGGFEGTLTEKSSFNISFSNLGFIQWNDQTLNYHTDTTQKITGNFVNFFDPYTVTTQDFSDTFQQFIYGNEKKESKLKALPAQFDLNYKSFLKEKMMLELRLRYISGINYRPKFTVGLHYFINQRTFINPSFVFGGYSNINFQLAFAKNFGSKFSLQAGIYGVESIAFYNKLSGMGAHLGMFLKL